MAAAMSCSLIAEHTTPERLDLFFAVVFNIGFAAIYRTVHLVPQTMRPIPGQLLPLSANGTAIFVRDPQHDHAMAAQSVPNGALFAMVVATLVILIVLSLLPSAIRMGGLLTAPTAWLWAVGFTNFLTDCFKKYVGRCANQLLCSCTALVHVLIIHSHRAAGSGPTTMLAVGGVTSCCSAR